ncbi:MAG: lipid-A-disaccharide synthase [Saprospiraceae bacterium]|nr:lipid-A-disaccharide synthase [Saprospiraceae bacterium]
MKYYIISGESSGDMHGANLIRSIRSTDDESSIKFWGGDKMLRANGEKGLDQHIRETSFMGFSEVIINLNKILNLFKKAKKNIIEFSPDVVILIDYPGFNMRMARWLKKEGYKVVYYIVPQVWAWKEKRAFKLEKYSDLILTILPFEKEWFQRKGITVEYVGHPLLDELKTSDIKNDTQPNKGIALLPGSRKQEILHILKPMLQACSQLPYNTIRIAKVSTLPTELYEDIISGVDLKNRYVSIEENNTYEILKNSEMALVSSGTATLETAVIGTPQVVCYIGSRFSYMIAKRLVKLKFISLVNLIMDAPLVPELIQEECNVKNIIQSEQDVMNDRISILDGYQELRVRLGGSGASDRAAQLIRDLTS